MTVPRRGGRTLLRRGGIWWLATILLLLVAVLALTGKNGALQTLRLRSIQSNLAAEVQTLRDENAGLHTELTSLRRGDAEAIERRAREDLGMVRQGEIRIDFREPASPAGR
jgi:cell division protein FtsB